MTDLNDWQPTTPDNLPWGKVVEVRWPDVGTVINMSPCIESGIEYWFDEDLGGEMYYLAGTEWRRLECGEAQG